MSHLDEESFPATVTCHLDKESFPATLMCPLDGESFPATVICHLDKESFPAIMMCHLYEEVSFCNSYVSLMRHLDGKSVLETVMCYFTLELLPATMMRPHSKILFMGKSDIICVEVCPNLHRREGRATLEDISSCISNCCKQVKELALKEATIYKRKLY